MKKKKKKKNRYATKGDMTRSHYINGSIIKNILIIGKWAESV